MREQKEINKRIGFNIRTARENARYTQEQLSEIIGVTPNHLSAIERGVSGASLEIIEKLCSLLGISADYLLFGTPEIDNATMKIARQLGNVSPEYRPHVHKVLSSLLEVLAIKGK